MYFFCFNNLLPHDPAQFFADSGSPVRYLDYDDAVHNYFAAIAEPAMRDKHLYDICTLVKQNPHASIVFCGTQFGGGVALISAAIAVRNFGIPKSQLALVQFSAPAVASQAFAKAFAGTFYAINLIRPNDPLALPLASLKYYPFGQVQPLSCDYSNILDMQSLYATVANTVCANYLSDVWNHNVKLPTYNDKWFAPSAATQSTAIDIKNINDQQYLFLGSLSAGCAQSIYNNHLQPLTQHLVAHGFDVTRYNGVAAHPSLTIPEAIPTYTVIYSQRRDTDGKNYYIVGLSAPPAVFVNRLKNNFIVQSDAFGPVLQPISDDINQLLMDKKFATFISALKADDNARVLISGHGVGGSYAAYLAALVAADPAVARNHIRLLTLGDTASVSARMQEVLTNKVLSLRVNNYRDVSPLFGELLTTASTLTQPQFLPQHGATLELKSGYLPFYNFGEYAFEKYFGIVLKNSANYIKNWNDEAWNKRIAAPASHPVAPADTPSPKLPGERLICVTSECEPWY